MDPIVYYVLAGTGVLTYVSSVLVLMNMVFISTKYYNIVDTPVAGCTIASMFLFMPLGFNWVLDGNDIIASHAAVFGFCIVAFSMVPLYVASYKMKQRFQKPISVRP